VTTQVAATDDALDEDLVRLPAGEVHGWWRGQNETVCGLSLSRSRLRTFPGLVWADVQPESGGSADLVQAVCPRCRAAIEGGPPSAGRDAGAAEAVSRGSGRGRAGYRRSSTGTRGRRRAGRAPWRA
jgi:hypothetical protein